ncbi:beta-galactosidase [Orenia metallireducens]|jgi:beta-galactosidase|uniref:Beta-galactosidase n=1 Tax=Orenia metallireducens TaxID=1413210 RepID=A0A285H735_9FIRM|nr:glycoside hydrolase family 2 TIM barrel-domain containing protein [Orenia metallireducens]PRX28593.1 beta-galactosidase [Orenia metallireducens]SNY30646.1 beta-galactosidase [Orenia metallireducens]
MRRIISLNRDWRYISDYKQEYLRTEYNDEICEIVNIPHANKTLPFNYTKEKDYQFVSFYQKDIFIPKEYRDQNIFIKFEGVMTYAKVFLNGEYLGEHKGGYTGFEILLNSAVKFEANNTLSVVVDSTERADIPPFGDKIDYLTYGGIYREVELKVVDKVFIENIFAKPTDVLEDKKRVDVDIAIANSEAATAVIPIAVTLKDGDRVIEEKSIDYSLSGKLEEVISLELENLEDIELWDIDNPKLYQLEVELRSLDKDQRRIGFRTAEFKAEGFYLNGEKVKIKGMNRHQSYPYVGYAMPERIQKKDADILKDFLRLNLVRTSHYPQSKHFLDRCDEIGLLVFEELPGWQHIGDDEWKEVAKENIREMIKRDFNRPSIILWGVRINESADDHDFYIDTNRIAKELDPTRQTGGVRCITDSELLEDVYTFNDFILGNGETILREQEEVTGLSKKVPYLVTEYSGHMYPTRRYDTEERQTEHTLRHYKILNQGNLDDYISGVIGWCAFDYNTHRDFGSEDRICYHGVMDIFRIPKFAAYVYHSQVSPEVETVLEPITVWTRGERSEAIINPLVIATNCDKVNFYYGDELYGTYYPDDQKFKALEYPPIIIEDFGSQWGKTWQDAKFIGYYNGVEVINKKLSCESYLADIEVVADDYQLNSGDWDATRVVIKAVDNQNNQLKFYNGIVELEITGVGEIIGPKLTTLHGGSLSTWLKTSGAAGKIELKVKVEDHIKQIEIDVV